MALRSRAHNATGDVVAFTTSPNSVDDRARPGTIRPAVSPTSSGGAPSNNFGSPYTNESGGTRTAEDHDIGMRGNAQNPSSGGGARGSAAAQTRAQGPLGGEGGGTPTASSASALAAAFTENLQRATQGDAAAVTMSAPSASSPVVFSSSSSSFNLTSSLNKTQQQVDYKGVTLLPGIEQIQFGDSYYLGTVDTEGRMAGYGKATWLSGDEYEGEWLNDRMHGKGMYRWHDGDYYRGEYEDGYMNGYGEMKDATGLYVGEWVDDMRQGRGRMEYVGGNVYEGEWLGGMRHGHGKLTESNGIIYEGEFVRNEKEGKGVQTNAQGDIYDGDFASGKPNGRGTYIWHDGAKYVGYFKDGLKHGEGCEWLPDGDWIAGNFVNGEHDEGQVVRHKAIASDFQVPELSDQLAAVLEPLDPRRLLKLTSAAQAAERRIGRGGSIVEAAPGTYRARRASNAVAAATVDLGSAAQALAATSPSPSSHDTGAADTADGADGDVLATQRRPSKAALSATVSGGEGIASPFAMTLRPTQLTDKDFENWTQLKIIGKGSFGAVYEALLTTGRTVCCKVIELGNVENCEELDKLKNEIALMKRMHHPNIVQYYGSTEDKEKNTMNIFMELVSGGSLNSFVRKFKSIPMQTMRQWTFQMVCGVKYLHDCGIVHRDIKGDNVLVSLDGIVKLADFGCSKSIDDACSATHGCATMVGTPYWMAPEVIKCEAGGYGAKSDVWSIGCTIVEMITGKPPWPECNSMWAAVYKIANSTGLPTEIPSDLDPQLMNLLERCFERDPRKRASAAELLEHPFLAEVAAEAAAEGDAEATL